jgi:hypothetical protein
MRLSPWGRVVAISALLVVGGALALAIGAVATTREIRASYPITGTVEGLTFDLGDGDIVVVGGGRRDAVEVQRSERYSFGHRALTAPRVDGSSYRVLSRCPTSLLGPCEVGYRIVVPDNVALDIRTSGGHVRLQGYRGTAKVTTGDGAIDISGYCGNSLDARAGAGAIRLQASCAAPRLSLRSGSGTIRAVLPPGRYDLDAESTSGSVRVLGVTARDDAPYSVQVLSSSGDVSVEGRS